MAITLPSNWFILIPSFLLLLFAVVFHSKGRHKGSVLLLLLSALSTRVFMAGLDPFLHDWDERFHALVAKNMISDPFVPKLRAHTWFAYDFRDWCNNHIWIHKQPLFLWQMALSMYLLGGDTFALRLPSVIMGTVQVVLVWRIAYLLSQNRSVAFLAAVLQTFSFYHLQLISGQRGMDHNDVAFVFYVTASIWAWCEYIHRGSWGWALVIGLLAGCAVLNKWLIGMVVYFGWIVYLLLDRERRRERSAWTRLFAALCVTAIVCLPWQLYVLHRFPVEARHEFSFAARHFWEVVEGHARPVWYYLNQLPLHIGRLWLPTLLLGVLVTLTGRRIVRRDLAIGLLADTAIVFVFFSLAASKLPSYTFVASPLLFVFTAIGLYTLFEWLVPRLGLTRFRTALFALLVLVAAAYTMKFWKILDLRASSRPYRQAKLDNTALYKALPDLLPPGHRIVLNVTGYEHVELMFFTDLSAHAGWGTEAEVRRMASNGIPLAYFPPARGQTIPDYIEEHPDVFVIPWPTNEGPGDLGGPGSRPRCGVTGPADVRDSLRDAGVS